MNRSAWHARTSAVVLAWLAAAADRGAGASAGPRLHLADGAPADAGGGHQRPGRSGAGTSRSRCCGPRQPSPAGVRCCASSAVNAGALAVVAGVLLDVAPAVAVGAAVLAGAVLSHVGGTAHDDAPGPAQPVRDHGARLRGRGAPADPGHRPGGGLADGSQAPTCTASCCWPRVGEPDGLGRAAHHGNARDAVADDAAHPVGTRSRAQRAARAAGVRPGHPGHRRGRADLGPPARRRRDRRVPGRDRLDDRTHGGRDAPAPPGIVRRLVDAGRGRLDRVVPGLLRPGARAEPGRGDGDPEHGDTDGRRRRRRRPPGAPRLP